jgi:arylmalonate decarboxylase
MHSSRREFLQVSAAALAAVTSVSAAEPVLGMIFPPANYPVPPEAKLMYPKGIRFLAEGVGLERMTPEGSDHAVPKILPAAEKLAKRGANAISIMGTSLTFYKGAAFNNDLIAAVGKATGLPATSMSRGIVEGLKAVGAKRVAVATAYNETVNGRLRIFLEESGFEVLGVKGMGIERFEDRPPVTQDELFNFGATTYESLLISCGALNTLRLLDPLEKRCKVPVVSSAPHALWASVRLLGLSGQAKGYGQLLSRA